jgi:chemotaxis family two-component system sensor kinase Cph1
MTLKDIRFTNYTTLATCESEPIHVPGTIQPYGVLLVINIHSFSIEFCSANSFDFLGLEVKTILGKRLDEIIGIDESNNIKQFLKDNSYEQFYTLTYQDAKFSTFFHSQGDLLMLEIEPFLDTPLSLPDLFKQSRNFIDYIEVSPSLRKLCSHVVNEIREITGYDRVMVYRFDKEYNGEVYAESLNENVESFLGLHYPHTDIPAQARALFVRNLLRMIPDVNYVPVPVLTLNQDASHQSVDMSSGVLVG